MVWNAESSAILTGVEVVERAKGQEAFTACERNACL